MAVKAQSKLSPAQRAVLFAQYTRQYENELESMVFAEGQTRRVTIPKARFLSKVYLRVKGTFKCSHATKTTFTKANFDMYRLLRQVRIRVNDGNNPYQISGTSLHLKNILDKFNAPTTDVFNLESCENVVSVAGATNDINFTLDLPITINDRDPIGLIMLNSDQTSVTVEVDCGYFTDMMTDTDIVVSEPAIYITPIIETFSIPFQPDAVPDYSIVKIVNEQIEGISSSGEMIIRLPAGLTYRKILIYIASDTDFTPIAHANIGSFSISFQQADTPYNISADQLAYKNKRDYAGQLPLGCYAFDFSSQGIPNLGGSRDYIDTENLTEFWLKVNFKAITGSQNWVYVISEKLARLV